MNTYTHICVHIYTHLYVEGSLRFITFVYLCVYVYECVYAVTCARSRKQHGVISSPTLCQALLGLVS